MKVQVIKEFIDKKENAIRKIDEVFDVSKERFEEINKSSYGPFVKEVVKGEKING